MKTIISILLIIVTQNVSAQINWEGSYEYETSNSKEPYSKYRMSVYKENEKIYTCFITIIRIDRIDTLESRGIINKNGSLDVYVIRDSKNGIKPKTKFFNLSNINGNLFTTFYYPKTYKPLIRYKKVERFSH